MFVIMPSQVKIYHNPQCSKSREALEYLRERGWEPEVIEYLDTPPTLEELRALVKLLGVAPSSLIRAKDFQRLGLTPTTDGEEWLALITSHPAIMERPIVVMGNQARIGRPIERLHDLTP